MRPLTDQETERLFEKLASYMGRNIKALIDRPDDPHVFRLQRDRVYYVRESIAKLATCVARDKLLSIGTCLGKFTKKTQKFKLHITALDHVAQHAKYKVWVKPNGEMPLLYGNHVVKAHVGRMTEDTPEHQGVMVFAMNDTPLGFGVTARSTAEVRRLDPTAITVFRQADAGEYLREVCLQIFVVEAMANRWNRKIPCSRCGGGKSFIWIVHHAITGVFHDGTFLCYILMHPFEVNCWYRCFVTYSTFIIKTTG
jgi:60S ribosome subunit biogenesis protein NIP7